MARQQQDISGFRRSHSKIPTRTAMLDDQKELAAKQKAVSGMGQGGAAKAAKTGPRKPLSSYQNPMQPIGSAPTGGPELPLPTSTAASGIVGSTAAALTRNPNERTDSDGNTFTVGTWGEDDGQGGKFGDGAETPKVGIAAQNFELDTTNRYDPNRIGNDLYDTYQRLNDQEASEERIARARAAQEGMIRATMGAGEAGRSGAAALLQGEGGRMAEGAARAEELARDLEVAELGSALRNFDYSKERYNDTEKKQAASAIMSLINAYDVDYDEAITMLQLPPGVASEDHKKVVNDWRAANFTDDDGDETTETETTETETTETSSGSDDPDDWAWVDDVLVGVAAPGLDIAGGLARGEIHDVESFMDALGWAVNNSVYFGTAQTIWNQIMTSPQNR